MDLFGNHDASPEEKGQTSEKLTRLDIDEALKKKILPFCRLKQGEIWEDSKNGHRVGLLDATSYADVDKLMNGSLAQLAIHDPPYNLELAKKNTKNLFKINIDKYLSFSRKWITNSLAAQTPDSHLYIWLGADQNESFQPLPDFMLLLREFEELKSRSFITMRNQRGYGTQKNWMCVRQELLYYTKGNPDFKVVYTDIPKVLKGYYKVIGGELTDNLSRSKSDKIRPGNVWLDIQQVFYRMEENVPGAYAQKPLKAIERIIESSSKEGDLIIDFFAHSGSTLLAADRLKRRCYTLDNDPVFAELAIRRLENYRNHNKTGWQWNNPFPEIDLS